jgi:predicted nucleotidyltransferase component of viral defense system
MLSYFTVEPHTLELLKGLTAEPLLKELRLVGGTSLALQYGHRQSVDLDFFGSLNIADNEELKDMLRSYGELKVLKETENIKIYIIDDVKVDIVNYKYPWIDEPVLEDGLRLASPKDIAAMKINAIEGRGTKKDFIDVAELLKHFSLQQLLDFHAMKYSDATTFRAMLSLSYFEDAELQPMPKMFIADTWEQMKNKIKQALAEI